MLQSLGSGIITTIAVAPEIYDALSSFFAGRISGRELGAQLIGTTASAGGALYGAGVGASMGAALGPPGLIIGTLAGAWVGHAGGKMIEAAIRWVLGLAPNAAVSKAYHALKMNPNMSNEEVYRACKQQMAKAHPDRNSGKHDMFLEIQFKCAVIYKSRGMLQKQRTRSIFDEGEE